MCCKDQKTKVIPSQSISNKYYQAWAVIEKDLSERPGGKILSAYCSCTAGMLGTYNHIAGLLFRIEHAVKTGLTKQAYHQRGMFPKENLF